MHSTQRKQNEIFVINVTNKNKKEQKKKTIIENDSAKINLLFGIKYFVCDYILRVLHQNFSYTECE